MLRLSVYTSLISLVTCITLWATVCLGEQRDEALKSEALKSEALKSEALKSDALTLEGLLSCARANNPAWDIAHAQLEEARSKLKFAQMSALPSFKFTGALAPLPARRLLRYCVEEPGGVNVVPCPNQEVYDDQRLDQVDGMGVFARTQMTLSQPLYTFGKITHGKAAARAGVEAYRAGLNYAEQVLDVRAVQIYFGLQLSEQLLKMIKKGRARLNKLKKKIQADLKAEAGNYTSNDLNRIIIQEGDLTSRTLEVEALKRQAIESIRVACMFAAEDSINLNSTRLKPIEYQLPTGEVIFDQARARRLDLKMARAQVTARAALANKALSDLFPDLGLVGLFTYSVGTSAEDNPDPFANDPFNVLAYGFYLGLNWNFSIAKMMSGPRQANATLRKARAQLKGLEQQVKLELIEYSEQVRRYEGTLEAKKEAMRAAKKWLTSTFINIGSGLVPSGQALKSLSAYFQATAAYEQSVYEYNLAVARLWRATGGDLAELLAQP